MRRVGRTTLGVAASAVAWCGCVLTTNGFYSRPTERPLDATAVIDGDEPTVGIDALSGVDATLIEDVAKFEVSLATAEVVTPDITASRDASRDAGFDWRVEPTPVGERDLRAVWVNQRTGVVWIGGVRGALARRDPSGAWSDHSVGTVRYGLRDYHVTVEAISGGTHGSEPGEVWFACTLTSVADPVERRGALLGRRADRPAMAVANVGASQPFRGVYFDPVSGEVWATTEVSELYRFFAPPFRVWVRYGAPARATLRRLAGSPPGVGRQLGLTAASSGGVVRIETPIVGYSPIAVPGFGTAQTTDIASADGMDVFRAMVADTTVGVIAGPTVDSYRTPYNLFGVFVTPLDLVAVGARGTVLRITSPGTRGFEAFALESAETSVTLNDVDGVIGSLAPGDAGVRAGEAWAVGQGGVVLHHVP